MYPFLCRGGTPQANLQGAGACRGQLDRPDVLLQPLGPPARFLFDLLLAT